MAVEPFNWSIVGQERVKKILQAGLKNEAVAQAYIFYGPAKAGKMETAKILAKALVCQRNYFLYPKAGVYRQETLIPCQICESCRYFEKKIHPDIYWLEREVSEKTELLKNAIGVDQVRKLQEKIGQYAMMNGYKVVLVPEAQYLKKEAANCLLKTLEEPTLKTVLILIAPSKETFLPTILSRCQMVKFSPIKKLEIYEGLISQGANREEAKMLAGLAQGRFKVAADFYEQADSFNFYQASLKELVEILGQDNLRAFGFIDKLVEEKNQALASIILDNLAGVLRDLLLIKNRAEHLVANSFLGEALTQLAMKLEAKFILEELRRVEATRHYIKANISLKVALENLLVR